LFGQHGAVAADAESLRAVWRVLDVREDARAREAAEERRDDFDGDRPLLRIACVPTLCAEALGALDLASLRWRRRIEPGVAVLEAELGEALHSNAGEVREIAAALERRGFEVEPRNAPGAFGGELGSSMPGLDLMRALKDQLDPHGVFARGRLHREL
jgi:hypothetical protein